MPVRYYNYQSLYQETTTTILCTNLGNQKSAANIILQAAWEAVTDVLFLQKPLAARKANEWLTEGHSDFNKYIPFSIGTEVERQWFAKNTHTSRSQLIFLCGNCPDYSSVLVEGISIASVYRAPGTEGMT